MPGEALTVEERVAIEVAVGGGRRLIDVAVELGRDPSTIRREVARNGGPATYSAVRAQDRADRCRARPKHSKLEADPVLAAYVTERLLLKDSPNRIAIDLRQGAEGVHAEISHETIYQAVYAQRGISVESRQCLHLKRRRRKRRGQQQACSTHSLGTYLSIRERPAIALARTEVGHFEGDLITGAYNRSAKITMFDRASRRLWLRSVASKSADDIYAALVELLLSIPLNQRRTLTWDQGSELARHRELTEHCQIPIYICDKNSPWQRPTNENGNALVRRYVGHGINLNTIDTNQTAWIEHRINTIPRRSLNWDTALTAYARLSAPTP